MPLVSDVYDVAGGDFKATYTTWRRVLGGGIEPMFIPASTLHISRAGVDFDFAANEVTVIPLSAPSAFVLTVTLTRTIDTGAVLFSLLLPQVAVANNVGDSADIEAVAIVTTIRTFLPLVPVFPTESYAATELTGHFSQTVQGAEAETPAAARIIRSLT